MTERQPHLKVSRRGVIAGAAGAAIFPTIATSNVTGDNGDVDIELAGDVGEDTYAQFFEGQVDEFKIEGDTEIVLAADEDDGTEAGCQINMKADGEKFDTNGYQTIGQGDATFQNNEAVFVGENLWGPVNEQQYITADGDLDLATLDGLSDDYWEISAGWEDRDGIIGEPISESINENFTNETSFTMEFKFGLHGGTIAEEIIEFDLNIAVSLGFGSFFGANFGKSTPESWP